MLSFFGQGENSQCLWVPGPTLRLGNETWEYGEPEGSGGLSLRGTSKCSPRLQPPTEFWASGDKSFPQEVSLRQLSLPHSLNPGGDEKEGGGKTPAEVGPRRGRGKGDESR